jgi:hypothetical protein
VTTLLRVAPLMALVAIVARAEAQPAEAIGKPLPDPKLRDGTVVLRVIAGDANKPASGVEATLMLTPPDGISDTAALPVEGGRRRRETQRARLGLAQLEVLGFAAPELLELLGEDLDLPLELGEAGRGRRRPRLPRWRLLFGTVNTGGVGRRTVVGGVQRRAGGGERQNQKTQHRSTQKHRRDLEQ